MAAGFLLALREGLEAALIVSVALGVLYRAQLRSLSWIVWMGVASAVAVSLVVGGGLAAAGAALEGAAEQIFEGVTMLLAATILTWMVFWLRAQGRSLQAGIEADVKRVAGTGQRWALFWLAFLAVLREGIELSLFLLVVGLQSGAASTLLGGLAGLAAAAAIGWGLYTATLRLNLRRFFSVTGALLVLFAAGLVGHGTHEFVEAGLLPALAAPIWDTGRLLAEDSPVGSLLRALFGYNADPSLSETIAYIAYLAAVAAVSLRQAPLRKAATEV